MVRKNHLFSVLGVAVAALAISACTAKEMLPVSPDNEIIHVDGREVPMDAYVPGMLHIKVTEALSKSINIQTDASGKLVSTGVKSLNDIIPELNIYKIQRTFPHAGEYEARTRKAGLHLWYNVYFDNETPLSRAGESVASIDGVQIMEYRPVTVRVGNQNVVKVSSQNGARRSNSATELFDDPYLGEQWHYYNDGTICDRAIAGSDINVLPVWKKGIVGSPDVIVSVVDGGIDILHEDLVDNLWTGTDEEGNVIYGYDFVDDDYSIEPDDHGTHVAGTIGAVNNNGKGVAGVAGGDKAKGLPGVKLMSCQIFSQYSDGPGHVAIKWAADHGSVITQNSWGYNQGTRNDTPQVDKDAIDYFVKYAGMDSTGTVQVGPMAGGIVIFAAGNESAKICYPAAYENCIGVAATTSAYTLARYTNYGPWINVSAPGGESNDDYTFIDGIMSTIPDNGYGLMSGTSMACPHVSGLAALLVSHFGGPGFTSEELWDMLTLNVTPINEYNENAIGLFGTGLINAERAIMGITEGGGANAITDLTLSVKAERINISFTVPGGQNVKEAYIYYSEEPLTEENFDDSQLTIISMEGLKAGDTFTTTVNTGTFNKNYYVAATTLSTDYKMSALSNVEAITTDPNTAPTIEILDNDTIRIKIKSETTSKFIIKDVDEHVLTPSVSPQFSFITLEYGASGDTLSLVFNGKKATKGERDIELIVEDEYKKSVSVPIHLIIAENSAPELIENFQDISFQSIADEPVIIDIRNHVHDADMDPLTVNMNLSGDDAATISVDGPMMTVTPIAQGEMTVGLNITDPMGASVINSFKISVLSSDTPGTPDTSDSPLTLYPNPVIDNLYIRANQGKEEGQVKIYAPTGALVFDETMEIGSAPIDMTSYPAGSYTIKVTYKENEITSQIVKL